MSNHFEPTRRQFLAASAATAATAAALAPSQANADNHGGDTKFPEPAADAKFEAPYGEPLFKISVAQWSLNKLFWDKKVDNRDFELRAPKAAHLHQNAARFLI